MTDFDVKLYGKVLALESVVGMLLAYHLAGADDSEAAANDLLAAIHRGPDTVKKINEQIQTPLPVDFPEAIIEAGETLVEDARSLQEHWQSPDWPRS